MRKHENGKTYNPSLLALYQIISLIQKAMIKSWSLLDQGFGEEGISVF
jgi:hypothetical protein